MRPFVIPARLSTCESRLYPHDTRDPRGDQGTSPACTPLCVCAQPPQPLSPPCSLVSIFTSCLTLYLSFSLMQRNCEEENANNPWAPHQERTLPCDPALWALSVLLSAPSILTSVPWALPAAGTLTLLGFLVLFERLPAVGLFPFLECFSLHLSNQLCLLVSQSSAQVPPPRVTALWWAFRAPRTCSRRAHHSCRFMFVYGTVPPTSVFPTAVRSMSRRILSYPPWNSSTLRRSWRIAGAKYLLRASIKREWLGGWPTAIFSLDTLHKRLHFDMVWTTIHDYYLSILFYYLFICVLFI